MTLVLGVDTATRVATGLADRERVIAERHVDGNASHVERLMPLVQECLSEAGATTADLTAIVVGVGPGPFTGLRVGIATARVLGSALGVPVRGVCSLDVLALAAPAGDVIVCSDARRRELYWARYRDHVRITGPSVGPADSLPKGVPVHGPGAALYGLGEEAQGVGGGALALHGPQLPDIGLEPLYLRRPDATVPGPRKSALVGRLRERR